ATATQTVEAVAGFVAFVVGTVDRTTSLLVAPGLAQQALGGGIVGADPVGVECALALARARSAGRLVLVTWVVHHSSPGSSSCSELPPSREERLGSAWPAEARSPPLVLPS